MFGVFKLGYTDTLSQFGSVSGPGFDSRHGQKCIIGEIWVYPWGLDVVPVLKCCYTIASCLTSWDISTLEESHINRHMTGIYFSLIKFAGDRDIRHRLASCCSALVISDSASAAVRFPSGLCGERSSPPAYKLILPLSRVRRTLLLLATLSVERRLRSVAILRPVVP
uniref:Uncharacterized protein n=1 Tax=Timema poppense TaxID=170557 RepID=A0A7R9D2W0_TIMPO|nr:unnamed protein product [Timema poppensis]